MKKIICTILSLTAALTALCSCSKPQAQEETTASSTFVSETEATEKQTEILGGLATSGEWGSAQWELYHSGELVFKGSGALSGADENESPDWMLYNEYIKTLIISDGITSIGENLFSSMVSLTKVSLPDTLTEIKEGAFAGCSALKELSLPDSVVEVEELAFENSSLEKIKLGAALAEISPLTFEGCKMTNIQVSEQNPNFSTDKYGVLFNKDKTSLIWYSCGFLMNSYSIPEGVLSISENAFRNEYLSEIVLPEGLTEISKNAFSYCLSLKSISIPSTVTEIGSGAFLGCRSIKEFSFPDGITHIRSEVLSECDSLKSVNIPTSVVYIGEKAFGSQATFEINYDGSKESWENISVAENNSAVSYASKHYGL